MKRFLFLAALCITLMPQLKADTIDFWRLHYNKKEVANGSMSAQFVHLPAADIRPGDTLYIGYFCDAPCGSCFADVTVEDQKHHVKYSVRRPEGQALPVPAQVLKDAYAAGTRDFEIHYFREPLQSRADSQLLFRVRLE